MDKVHCSYENHVYKNSKNLLIGTKCDEIAGLSTVIVCESVIANVTAQPRVAIGALSFSIYIEQHSRASVDAAACQIDIVVLVESLS